MRNALAIKSLCVNLSRPISFTVSSSQCTRGRFCLLILGRLLRNLSFAQKYFYTFLSRIAATLSGRATRLDLFIYNSRNKSATEKTSNDGNRKISLVCGPTCLCVLDVLCCFLLVVDFSHTIEPLAFFFAHHQHGSVRRARQFTTHLLWWFRCENSTTMERMSEREKFR